MKKYFTIEEIKEDIAEKLSCYSGCYCDLHNEVFNTNYYIVGTAIAKEALEQYGVFNAIEEIQTYERDNFGEVYTDLGDPKKVANMLYYILGENFMFNGEEFGEILNEHWDETASDEVNEQLIKSLELQ